MSSSVVGGGGTQVSSQCHKLTVSVSQFLSNLSTKKNPNHTYNSRSGGGGGCRVTYQNSEQTVGEKSFESAVTVS